MCVPTTISTHVETVCLLEFLQGVNWNSEHDKKIEK